VRPCAISGKAYQEEGPGASARRRFLRKEDIEKAGEVELFMPPKVARLPANRGKELEPKKGDSPAILRWNKRMASDAGKEIYKERAATSETVNADL
jgi:hypothetical protein